MKINKSLPAAIPKIREENSRKDLILIRKIY